MDQRKDNRVKDISHKKQGGGASSLTDRENSSTFANKDREEVQGRTGSSSGSTRNTPLNQGDQRGMGGIKKAG